MPLKDDSAPTKAERAAAARSQRKSAQEAAALRANLLRRKAQNRARAIKPVEGREQKNAGDA